MLRWPQYASGPQLQEHVTDEGSKTSSLAKRIRKGQAMELIRPDLSVPQQDALRSAFGELPG